MKDSKYFVDTNIFLRVLVRDEEKSFHECAQFLQKIRSGRICGTTSTVVLAEIVWTLLHFYHFSKPRAIEGLRSILQLKNLTIEDNTQLTLAVELYENQSIKFVDALIASHPLIQNKQIIVISYDRDFDKLGVARKEPGQV